MEQFFRTREFKASSRRLQSNDTKHNKWFESHLLAMFLRVDGIDFPFDMKSFVDSIKLYEIHLG